MAADHTDDPSPDAEPSLGASQGPAATGAGDAVWVESSIIDRPGVPAELYDKYWLALNQAGQVGTTARVILPSNEEIVGADAGLVVSFPVSRNEDEGTMETIVGPNGVVLTVRDIRTGTVTRTIESGVGIHSGLMTGSLLFFIGGTLPAQESIDAGIQVIDVADPASTPRAIIEPDDLTASYGPNATRSRLSIQDAGRAVVSTIRGDEASGTQVVDIAGLSPRATIHGEVAYEVADHTLLVRREDGLVLLNLETGRTVGEQLGALEVYKTFSGDGEVYAQYGPGPGPGVYISALSVESGERRDLLYQGPDVNTTYMDTELSLPSILVLFNDRWQLSADGSAYVQVTLLDPATGELQPDAFAIGNP